MQKGKATGGDIGDFATFKNLWPAGEMRLSKFKSKNRRGAIFYFHMLLQFMLS